MIETWTINLTRAPDHGTATLTRPGRASPVGNATRDTCERALLAVLTGARLDWVPGTHVATYRTKGGATKRVNLIVQALDGAK